MFSHVTVGSNDIARAKAFYDGVGKVLGLERLAEYPTAIGYGRAGGRPQLWILKPADKNDATVGNGITIALEASDRPTVDAAYHCPLGTARIEERMTSAAYPPTLRVNARTAAGNGSKRTPIAGRP